VNGDGLIEFRATMLAAGPLGIMQAAMRLALL